MTPSGTRLFVAAPGVGAVAELDTTTSKVLRTATVAITPGASTARATATADTLYLTVDDLVTPVTIADLHAGDGWTAPAIVTGIQPSNDGATLYVSLVDRVLALDPRTLREREELSVPTSEPIDHVAPALPPIPGDPYAKCAC